MLHVRVTPPTCLPLANSRVLHHVFAAAGFDDFDLGMNAMDNIKVGAYEDEAAEELEMMESGELDGDGYGEAFHLSRALTSSRCLLPPAPQGCTPQR